jgi:hypothetical protein
MSDTREIAGRVYTVRNLPPKLPKGPRNVISGKEIRRSNAARRVRQVW